jgi:hypothetical protein
MASLTRPEAVTLALHELGGADAAVDTEDVAIRVADIAPGMFAWQKYPDRIDKELVRVALSDARLKKKYVVGSHNKGGWMLTAEGQAFARESTIRVKQTTIERRQSRDDQHQRRERARMLSSRAFERFTSEGPDAITADEADAFFRLNIYVRGVARDRKIARAENQFADDPDLGSLVKMLAARARERS